MLGAHRRGARRAARGARPRGRAGARRRPAAGPLLHVDRVVHHPRRRARWSPARCGRARAARGDEVERAAGRPPGAVRAVEVHDEPVERAEAGQRVALNLAGVARDEVRAATSSSASRRGATGAVARRLPRRCRALVGEPDARPDGGARVAVHHGTRESAARLAELGGRFFQLRLEEPIVPLRGDRLVVRSLAPPDTLGGGVVLDPAPRRHGPSRDLLARLARLERGEEPSRAAAARAAAAPPSRRRFTAARSGRRGAAARRGAEPPLDSELATPRARDPARPRPRRPARPTMHVHPEALAPCGSGAWRRSSATGRSRSPARDELGTSRKFAQAYLEHLDGERVTLRRGDERVLAPPLAPAPDQRPAARRA